MLRCLLTILALFAAMFSCKSNYFAERHVLTLRFAVDTAGAVFGILSATIVLIVTMMTTVRQVLRTFSLGMKPALSQILLRDGERTINPPAMYQTNGHAIFPRQSVLSVSSCAQCWLTNI